MMAAAVLWAPFRGRPTRRSVRRWCRLLRSESTVLLKNTALGEVEATRMTHLSSTPALQAIFRQRKKRESGAMASTFRTPTEVTDEYVRPMFEVAWGPMLSVFSQVVISRVTQRDSMEAPDKVQEERI